MDKNRWVTETPVKSLRHSISQRHEYQIVSEIVITPKKTTNSIDKKIMPDSE
jgi:hypothetical protein